MQDTPRNLLNRRSLFWLFLDFRGRVSRREFLWSQAALLVLTILAVLILHDIQGDRDSLQDMLSLSLFLIWQAIWILGLAVAVKRNHDLGWRGGLVVLLLVPLAGIVYWWLLASRKGQPHDNAYGAAIRWKA